MPALFFLSGAAFPGFRAAVMPTGPPAGGGSLNVSMFFSVCRLVALLLLCRLAVGSPPPAAASPGPVLADARPFPLAGRPLEHRVAPGEYLYALARRYHVSYPAIARANRLPDPNRVAAGRVLLIPRQMILPAAPAGPGVELVVNIPEQRLYFFRDGRLEAIFPVAVGLPTWQTPRGEFSVTSLVRQPSWFVPPGISRERELQPGTVVPPGPDNPLGDYWIGTSIRHTGLHGTNVPMSVGSPVSRGCVRLYPDDIADLFTRVRPGDRGVFLYEPVKAAVLPDGTVQLEVHPDIYGLAPDFEDLARRRLAAAVFPGRAEVLEIDPPLLARVLAEARGVPETVGRLRRRPLAADGLP